MSYSNCCGVSLVKWKSDVYNPKCHICNERNIDYIINCDFHEKKHHHWLQDIGSICKECISEFEKINNIKFKENYADL